MSITADPETQTRVREALLSLGLDVPCGAEIALTDTGVVASPAVATSSCRRSSQQRSTSTSW